MYSFLVTATDPTDGKDVIRVNVMVNDVNEAPKVSEGATAITHPENETVLDIDLTNQPAADAAEYTATDPDMVLTLSPDDALNAMEADRLEWTTAGPDGSKFEHHAAFGRRIVRPRLPSRVRRTSRPWRTPTATTCTR